MIGPNGEWECRLLASGATAWLCYFSQWASTDGRRGPQRALTLVLPWECGPRAETLASCHHATVHKLGDLGQEDLPLQQKMGGGGKGSIGGQCEGERGLAGWSLGRCLEMVTKCWVIVNLLTDLQISSACLSWGHHVS